MSRLSPSSLGSERGSASIEFAFSFVLFTFVAFAIVEYGMIFNERLAVTSLAREGASLASRNLTTNANMLDMLTSSTAGPLSLKNNPSQYQIFLVQINGPTVEGNDPVCVTAPPRGSLSHVDISPPDPNAQCGLPDNLYNLLKWNVADDVPGINQFTVLTVYYQHAPFTPIGGMSASLGAPGHRNPSLLLSSRAIF